MLISTLKFLFNRDLLKLRDEISRYTSEELLWKIEGDISNSAGNLCLHLIGNLNTYIGKEIGGRGYIRNRELEFSLKNVPLKELLVMLDETIRMVDAGFDQLTESDLEKEFPIVVFEKPTSVVYMLMHLYGHLSYHLGQVNYHRRLVLG